MSIKYIKVTISPEMISSASGGNIQKCRIEVDDWATGLHSLCELIPDNDFQSRFEWLMDRAKKEIASLCKGD